MIAEMAPTIRSVPVASGQLTGEPENPGPIPVASMAGPETRTRMRAPAPTSEPDTTSTTRASKRWMAVPCNTERTEHAMPART
jgi:hypothetical protein